MKDDTQVGSIVLCILGLACICLLFSILPSVEDTPEYNEGYTLGYAEHNDTKYQAADDIVATWGLVYTECQTNYAIGYMDGYRAYAQDEKEKDANNRWNETAKILGV